jgi:hypothetical protein
MKLGTLLQEVGHPVAYFAGLTPITGGVTATLLLCQLYYWTGKQQNPDGWIRKSQKEFQAELGLTRREQETARRLLRTRNLIEERFVGCPRKLEFRPNMDALEERWHYFRECNAETSPLPDFRKNKQSTHRLNVGSPDEQAPRPEQTTSDMGCSTSEEAREIENNANNENSIMAESAIKECTKAPYKHGGLRHTSMADCDINTIYTEITSEITSETTQRKMSAVTADSALLKVKTKKNKETVNKETIEPTVNIPTSSPTTNVSGSPPDLEQKAKPLKKNFAAAKIFSQENFESEFWAVWPGRFKLRADRTARRVKGSKTEALAAWLKLNEDSEACRLGVSEIVAAVVVQMQARQEARENGEFFSEWPDAHRWLSKRRWLDEIEKISAVSGAEQPPDRTSDFQSWTQERHVELAKQYIADSVHFLREQPWHSKWVEFVNDAFPNLFADLMRGAAS